MKSHRRVKFPSLYLFKAIVETANDKGGEHSLFVLQKSPSKTPNIAKAAKAILPDSRVYWLRSLKNLGHIHQAIKSPEFGGQYGRVFRADRKAAA